MSNRTIVIGVILIVAGLALLGRTFDFFCFSFGDLTGFVFPVGLIAVGIWLMMRRRGQAQAAEASAGFFHQPDHTPPPPPDYTQEGARVSESPERREAGKFRYSKFIGDMFVDCNDVELQNVEISNFLGDVEVKLHGGKLRPGLNRMIISGFIGDVRVLVPQGMAVFARSSNFIGDIEMMGQRSSGFGNSLDAQTPNYADSESKLYIASNHFIGDVRIYVI